MTEEFIDIEIPLTESQEDFILTDEKYPAIIGGLGSGKTQGGTLRIVTLLLEDKGCNCAYYMPTYDLLSLRALPGIQQDLDTMGVSHSFNQQKYRIDVEGYGYIILRSYDNPKRIIAYEVAHSIIDEIDTLDYEKAVIVWRKISERNRQRRSKPNTIGVVSTPDQGFHGLVYKKWGKNPADGYVLIKAATTSNPYLPDDYVEQIRSNYDSLLAEMYINGDFVNLTANKVYHFFNRLKHHSSRTLDSADKYIYVSIDFNVGGCCAVVWIIDDNKPVAVDEFVSNDTYDFINNLNKYESHKITVFPDATGRSGSTNASLSDIELIENAGYSVDAPSANPAIKDRVNSLNALLSHDNFGINTDKCPELTNALESQGYAQKGANKGKPEKFDEHPAVDDWNDSAGYFINRKFQISKPATGLSVRFSY